MVAGFASTRKIITNWSEQTREITTNSILLENKDGSVSAQANVWQTMIAVRTMKEFVKNVENIQVKIGYKFNELD